MRPHLIDIEGRSDMAMYKIKEIQIQINQIYRLIIYLLDHL